MSNLFRIRTLTERFLEGETTLSEERELYAYYRHAYLPEDLLPLRPMFMGLETVEITEEEREHESAEAQEHEGTRARGRGGAWLRSMRWMAVAATVLLLIGGASLLWNRQQNECVAYIYGKKCTDQALIMQELERNIGTMAEGQNEIESQLNEIFNIN